MTGALHWDSAFPLLRLEGEGTRNFLQGQTSADVTDTPEGTLVQTCWLKPFDCNLLGEVYWLKPLGSNLQ